jgi:hypothetical protein
MLDFFADFEKPIFDFEAIESRTGLPLNIEHQDDINRAYEAYALSVLKQILFEATEKGEDFPAQPRGDIDQSDFKALVIKTQKTASELRLLVDRLADFDTGLLARPYDNRDRSIYGSMGRHNIDEQLGCSDASHTIGAQDFSDYFAFRKSLDYFEKFEKCNERFNNFYDLRYSFEYDYSDFEFLIRQIVVSLRRGGYPITITIPTDSNPHYESPMIAALLEFQKQHNLQYGGVILGSATLEQHFNYRKFAHLVGLILRQIADLAEAMGVDMEDREK